MRYLFLILMILINAVLRAQPAINTKMLPGLLKSHPEYFADILSHEGNNEVQILYTQINRDKQNIASFKSFGYRLDPARYFYPASTVKLAAVIFSLEKINRLAIPGLTARTTMITDSAFTKQTRVTKDSSSSNGLPSIEHYIKKILLTSDNDAFNRLYEFVGREELNRKLKENGAIHSRIINRLAIGDGGEQAKHTNPISFYQGSRLIYRQEAQYDPEEYPLQLSNLTRGKGYMDADDKLVNEPYSFAEKNTYPLADQQLIIRKLLFPESFAETERFRLTADDLKLIYTYMSMYPQESDFPKYDAGEFWPAYSKMIFYGRDKEVIPDPSIRIFNKYGDSYGYVIDNAYFVDFKNKVEFMLTAVVQSNEDGIYNDGKYEYETVCYPFLKNLGKVIYELELKRKKKRLPELDRFKLR